MRLILPLPPASLSPNKRNHWAVTSKAKKIERERAHALTLQWLAKAGRQATISDHLKITYHLPGNRKRDADNLLAASKAALDGMADALRIDDGAFNPITVERVYGADKPGYMLVEL
jgi:crossover junction endodeoxyribonuclease RusA